MNKLPEQALNYCTILTHKESLKIIAAKKITKFAFIRTSLIDHP
jgi:hypothetical protein